MSVLIGIITLGALCWVAWNIAPTNAQAAEFVGTDYPYFIFRDDGVIRYCMEPDTVYTPTIDCWAKGIKSTCDIIAPDAGYIDCPEITP